MGSNSNLLVRKAQFLIPPFVLAQDVVAQDNFILLEVLSGQKKSEAGKREPNKAIVRVEFSELTNKPIMGADQAGVILVNMGATWAFEFSANFTNIRSAVSFDETELWTQSNRRSSICSIMAADMQY